MVDGGSGETLGGGAPKPPVNANLVPSVNKPQLPTPRSEAELNREVDAILEQFKTEKSGGKPAKKLSAEEKKQAERQNVSDTWQHAMAESLGWMPGTREAIEYHDIASNPQVTAFALKFLDVLKGVQAVQDRDHGLSPAKVLAKIENAGQELQGVDPNVFSLQFGQLGRHIVAIAETHAVAGRNPILFAAVLGRNFFFSENDVLSGYQTNMDVDATTIVPNQETQDAMEAAIMKKINATSTGSGGSPSYSEGTAQEFRSHWNHYKAEGKIHTLPQQQKTKVTAPKPNQPITPPTSKA